MALVTSTQLIDDSVQPDGTRWVRYRFDLIDNLDDNHVVYHGPVSVPADWDTDADMLALSPIILKRKSSHESSEFIGEIEQGGDPLHFDNSGFWDKVTPRWDTWDNQFNAVSLYFWGLDSLVDIAPFSLCWSRVSNTDKRTVLGISNPLVTDLNADMQIAIDTKATLSQYQKHYRDGAWS